MEQHASPSLSEALTRFMSSKKNGKGGATDHVELGRFVAWCGRERTVVDVSPSEVADYAQYIGLGGVEAAHRLTPVKTFLGYWKDEGWIETGLAAHLRLPRSRRNTARKGSGGGVSAPEATQLSQEGYDRLIGQLADLKAERVGVTEDIRRAMEDKDFRENAPLDAAKERQAIIESRIRELEAGLTNTRIMNDRPVEPRQTSTIGAKVTLKDAASGKRLAYTLVDVREADAESGKISTTSPVGQALMNRVVGDEITINVPKGTLRYTVERVEG